MHRTHFWNKSSPLSRCDHHHQIDNRYTQTQTQTQTQTHKHTHTHTHKKLFDFLAQPSKLHFYKCTFNTNRKLPDTDLRR
jgi:hypothetical protein